MENEEYGLQSNQEANLQIGDLDLSLTLPDHPSTNKDTADGLKNVKKILSDRLQLAKKRESIIHGQKTGKYPSWYFVRPKCFLNLENKDDEEKFKGYWLELSTATENQVSQKVIEYLAKEIKEKEADANRIRADTIRQIGFTTKESAELRKNFDSDIMKINEENTSELENYRLNLNKREETKSASEDKGGKQPEFRNYGYRRPHYNENKLKQRGMGRFKPYHRK